MKKLFFLLFTTATLNVSAQTFTCGNQTTPNTSGGNNFTTTNSATCNNVNNYKPDINFPTHTPTKTIKVNIHYFVNKQTSDPMNFTETTGFNNSDNVNNGYTYANELISQINYQLGNNLQMNLPCNNSIPLLPIKIKFEIYKNPNIIGDKGVYFHEFTDVFLPNGQNNINSQFWYKHNPQQNKTLFSVNGNEVIDIFFKENINSHDAGGVAAGWYVTTNAATNISDMFEDAWGNVASKSASLSRNGATVIHEVGHMLGLDHTFQGGNSCPDITSYGVDNCNGSTNPTYSNNVMDYSGGYRGFTPCQLSIVNHFLELDFPQYVKCEFDAYDKVQILQNENITWNSTKHINGNIKINGAGKLTIKCDVFMTEHSKIIISQGGELIIDGGKITRSCLGLWDGIFIQGFKNNVQNNIYQGRLRMMNGAVVEYATKGAFIGNYWMNGNDIEYMPGSEGGIIIASNSTFRNCRKSVEFWPYHNYNSLGNEMKNVSSFTNCTFVNDDYLPCYDYNTQNVWGPEFVTMWDVQGVRFIGCNFKDNINTNFAPTLNFRTSAIGTFGAKFSVLNCTFENLYSGIRAESIFDPLDYIEINNSTLVNTHKNITSVNQFGDKIAGNTIKSQPAQSEFNSISNKLIPSWGIYMNGSNKYLIHDNTISSDYKVGFFQYTNNQIDYSGYDYNIGISASNSFANKSIIAENIVTNVSIGTQTEDDNYDLHIKCNTNSNNILNWFVNPLSPNGNLNDQGNLSILNPITPHNTFDVCTPNQNSIPQPWEDRMLKKQIRSELLSNFAYDEDAINGSAFQPDINCVTPNVILNSASITTPTTQNCNQYFPVESGNSNGWLDINTVNLANLSAIEKQQTLFNVAEKHSQEGEVDKLILTLQTINTFESAKYLTALYYSKGDFINCEMWMNSIINSTVNADEIALREGQPYPTNKIIEDNNDFTGVYSILIDALKSRRNIFQLKSEEIVGLDKIAEHETRGAKMAQSIIRFARIQNLPITPEVPIRVSNRLSNTNVLVQNNISVYPSPFDNFVTILSKFNVGEIAELVITDAVGNTIQKIKLNESNKEVKLNTQLWNSGMYIGTLFINNRYSSSTKFTKL